MHQNHAKTLAAISLGYLMISMNFQSCKQLHFLHHWLWFYLLLHYLLPNWIFTWVVKITNWSKTFAKWIAYYEWFILNEGEFFHEIANVNCHLPYLQLKLFPSLLWILSCVLKFESELKQFPQVLHLWGFWSVWMISCSFNVDDV